MTGFLLHFDQRSFFKTIIVCNENKQIEVFT